MITLATLRDRCRPTVTAGLALALLGLMAGAPAPAEAASIHVTLAPSVAAAPVDGRVIVALSKNEDDEPRNQVTAGVDAIQVFGVDVDALAPGAAAVVDGSVFGYPYESLDRLPAGRYRAQAVLHRYETFRRADGHVVKLPEDRGEGQHWNLAPGNFLSPPVWIDFDPAAREP
ncbi:MAG: hypothetical protein L0227_11040, partial [Chloroflexi bacterium]|nr:hypothetical protein [Chloroflexota bacterium]